MKRAIVIDRAGNGYTVLLEGDDSVWVSFPHGPQAFNRTELARFMARNQHLYTEVIEHTDFYARLPEGYAGRVV